MIHRWRHGNIKHQLWGIVVGFSEILDGLVIVLTFGYFGSGFSNLAAYKRSEYFFSTVERSLLSKPKEDTTNAI